MHGPGRVRGQPVAHPLGGCVCGVEQFGAVQFRSAGPASLGVVEHLVEGMLQDASDQEGSFQ